MPPLRREVLVPVRWYRVARVRAALVGVALIAAAAGGAAALSGGEEPTAVVEARGDAGDTWYGEVRAEIARQLEHPAAFEPPPNDPSRYGTMHVAAPDAR